MKAIAKQSIEFAEAPEQAVKAADAILGANPFVGLDSDQVIEQLSLFVNETLKNPEVLGGQLIKMAVELFKVVAGVSDVAPEESDKRFTDPTWSDNPFYRRVMQAYLVWRSTMMSMVPDNGSGDGEWKETEQQRFAVRLLTEALAPTNVLIGNPAALKRAFETGGTSLVHGLRSFFDDLWNNNGMPQTVDKRPFAVGRNLAVTPGAVVFRSEILELLQYAPATRQVYERPIMLVPPQINKFYVMDLAPKRSLTEYAVARGVPFFTVSWRNPRPEHRNWGLDEYVTALTDAVDAVCEISGSSTVNLLGVCSGGITSTLMLGHLAAAGDHRVNAASLIVTMLDSSMPSMTGMFTTREGVAAAIDRSRRQGVLNGAEMERLFAWLRPNDLVWNYWVNNYLMGKDPAPFDILYWNADSTNLPARLHAGFMELLLHNGLTRAGTVQILGTPIDLRQAGHDMFVVGGMTDHICAWRAVYNGARLFGGRTEFVLNSSGHVQTLVCPPTNFKAKYYVNSVLGADPETWVKGATEQKGSWWDHWLGWLDKRSGDKREAPASLGSLRFPPLEPAPGKYVMEQADGTSSLGRLLMKQIERTE
ncbi:MAG TPA: alpha/beta fold hydrolase [Candidatus Binataceae bacterium]|nr:alpha/beta fold hydrolase [Candidatus Binataceae bacterium]